MGVHISFMRSTELDEWKPEEARRMAIGGNGPAREFFKQHGCTDAKNRYTTIAAQMYKKRLDKICAGEIVGGSESYSSSLPRQGSDWVQQSPVTPMQETVHTFTGDVSPVDASSPVTTNVVAISSTTVIGKKPLSAASKSAVKKKGLGGGAVAKVDGGLEEASGAVVPASLLHDDVPKPAPKAAPTASTSSVTAPPSSRGRFYGISSEVTPASATASAAPVYDTSRYAQKAGPDFTGIGSSPFNPQSAASEEGSSSIQETLWQIGDAWSSLKEKAQKSQESLGNKIKDYLDDL